MGGTVTRGDTSANSVCRSGETGNGLYKNTFAESGGGTTYPI